VTATATRRRGKTSAKKATKNKGKAKTKAKTKGKSKKKPEWVAITFERIEKWREKLGLSKQGMAEALCVTNSTYHNWRRGTTVPHANQQEEILQRISVLEKSGGSTPRSTSGRKKADPKGGRKGKGGKAPATSGSQDVYTATPGTPSGSGKVLRGDVATITAAWIQSQKKAVSAGSVMKFVTELQSVL
jgi:DNA-binding transcriptional regulator YiaG